ncbi:SMC-Scp complex subunit ScpB [Nosocomiicoccus sp. HMSC09A07]|uniref:SMC-Scp complex subunit ScpB n=1 Tax=Nosocomiicoccus sp. HMSC09A07 TaxID=1581145 RepID=UPI0008A4C381|nr:SMC-Scp complex subunit ScpB [Nosocomiicoccus sp. HMSC09A07]OFS64224.1 hypothetical protein HMPREF3177_01460 [Nosocomiicoccus sp. HMSC09A07]
MSVEKIDIVEAMLYIAGDIGVKESSLIKNIPITKDELEQSVELYNKHKKHLNILVHEDIYYLKTTPIVEEYILKLLKERPSNKLSNQALEVLSIIAYNQPVARGMIEELRGVSPDGPIQTLLNKNLIQRVSIENDRRTFYKTTQTFLEIFGLETITDLPSADEIEEDEHIELFFNQLKGENDE